MLAYPMSKAALNMLTIQYARAFPRWRVNSVTPGLTLTEFTGRPTDSVDLEAFRRDGVIMVKQLLPAEWVIRTARAVDEVVASPTLIGWFLALGDGFSHEAFLWQISDEFRDLVWYSPMAHIAQQLMQSKSVRFFYDQLFCKRAGTQVPTPIHHDLTFWPITEHEERPWQIVSMWIPFDPVTKESSGLEYVKGSHKWGKRFKAVSPDYNPTLLDESHEDVPDVFNNRDKFDLVNWTMEPGDVLLFHPLTLHGSGGNSHLTRNRRALALRWVGEGTSYRPTAHTMPLPFYTGLSDGDPIGGSLYPQILPEKLPSELLERARGPVYPPVSLLLFEALKNAAAKARQLVVGAPRAGK